MQDSSVMTRNKKETETEQKQMFGAMLGEQFSLKNVKSHHRDMVLGDGEGHLSGMLTFMGLTRAYSC